MSYERLVAEFFEDVDDLFPPPEAGHLREDPGLRRRLALCMARKFWSSMPNPALGFAVPRLGEPGRNEPCYCGSGRKFKHCCQALHRDVALPESNLLSQVLERLPKQRWKELPGSRIELDRVAHTAKEWIDGGDAEAAQALLEPWFADDARFTARHELLFDLLLDVYTALDRPRKKSALLDRGVAHGDRALRSAAMQRRVSMLADQGKRGEAWSLFAEALRADPDSPSLSHLEVTLLLSEGREPEARARARFWLMKFERRRDPGLDGLIDLLREVAEHGAQGLHDAMLGMDEQAAALAALWDEDRPLAVRYTLKPQGDSAGPLTPDGTLAAALAYWQDAFPPPSYSPLSLDDDEDIWSDADAWLDTLQDHPVLWNSFEVLHGLVRAIQELPLPGTSSMVLALVERGERLLRAILQQHGAEGLKLEWGWMQNRPALSLIGAGLAGELGAPATPEHVARLEWLVLTLNPNDNQGFREVLMRCYLELDRFEDALALAARYPDDLAAMRYDEALALFALGRRDEATQALRAVVEDSPKLLAWLLKRDPRPPRLDPLGMRVGGDDEAWLYRDDRLPIWQRLGALEWAKTCAGTKRR